MSSMRTCLDMLQGVAGQRLQMMLLNKTTGDTPSSITVAASHLLATDVQHLTRALIGLLTSDTRKPMLVEKRGGESS